MTFAVPRGCRQVQSDFGIVPAAYEQGQTDGVLFTIEYIGEDGIGRVLFERNLDPKTNPRDRGRQHLTVELPEAGKGKIRFKTGNLPGKNTAWDWLYWTGVKFE